MNIRECVQELVEGIRLGKWSEVVDKYYADDVVINWTGTDDRSGKDANREYLEFFAHNTEVHEIHAESVIVDAGKAVIEWAYDITPRGGQRLSRRHVVVQTWADGRIIRQNVYVPGWLWPS